MIQKFTKTEVVGVDINCEQTTYAISDVRGNIIAKESFPTGTDDNISKFISDLCERIVAMAEANGGYERLRSIGVSVSSGNNVSGMIVNSGRLPWKGKIPLATILRDRLGLATAVGNESFVRALGESVYGCAHGMRNFIMISIGYGLSGSMFSRGRQHKGNAGFAGEIGHCCIYPDGRECSCGNKGCVEAYCSERGIVQTARELMAEFPDKPSLLRDCKDVLTTEYITACCEQGDELAIEVYRKTGFILGIALANYASVANPEAIVLTGKVMKAGKWLLEPMDESFEDHVFYNIKGKVNIMLSALHAEELNILGAVALAWKVKKYSLFK